MSIEVVTTVITVVVSSVLQSVLTVQGVKVHIQYLKEGLERAHQRIDELQARL